MGPTCGRGPIWKLAASAAVTSCPRVIFSSLARRTPAVATCGQARTLFAALDTLYILCSVVDRHGTDSSLTPASLARTHILQATDSGLLWKDAGNGEGASDSGLPPPPPAHGFHHRAAMSSTTHLSPGIRLWPAVEGRQHTCGAWRWTPTSPCAFPRRLRLVRGTRNK